MKHRRERDVVGDMSAPEQLVSFARLYLEVGLGVALPFVTLGVARVEPSAKNGSPLFRLLILPASTLLWPLVATRWVRVLVQKRTP